MSLHIQCLKSKIYVLCSSNKEQVIILSKKVIVKCLTVLCLVTEFVDLQMGLQTSSINVKGSLYVFMTSLTAVFLHSWW